MLAFSAFSEEGYWSVELIDMTANGNIVLEAENLTIRIQVDCSDEELALLGEEERPSTETFTVGMRIVTNRAAALLVEHMLDLACCSPHSYFDHGPVEGWQDGTVRLEVGGRCSGGTCIRLAPRIQPPET